MAILGNSNITGYLEQSGASANVIGQKFTMPAAGTLTDFWWYGFGAGATCRMRFAVYTDEATMNRVWASDEITPASNDGVNPAWTHVTGASGSLSNGASYWLVWNSNETDPHFYYTGSGSYPYYHGLTYGAFGATLARPDTAWSYANVGVYIEYSTGGTNVTPAPAIISGVADQPTPVLSGSDMTVVTPITGQASQLTPTLFGSAVVQDSGIAAAFSQPTPAVTIIGPPVGAYVSPTIIMGW